MPFGNGNFIDGDQENFMQARPSETTPEITELHVFNQVPANLQLARNVFDGHASRQPQGMALKCSSVTALRIGKTKTHLTYQTATPATDSLHRQHQTGRLGTDG